MGTLSIPLLLVATLAVVLPLALCDTPSLDVRINPALGANGNKLRVSVIDQEPSAAPYGNFFTYNEQFVYKWRNFSLHSVLTDATPGVVQKFTIANTTVVVDMPALGAGVEGLLFGDPCIVHTSYYWPCMEHIRWRLPALVNAMSSVIRPGRQSALDFWSILGDNFYDELGIVSRKVFDDLSLQVKSIPLLTVPGNHDYWMVGHPDLKTPFDQFGNGFMQFYGQDVLASKNNTVNFLDFSINPDGWRGRLASANNFFQYKIMGNVGYIGYSCAYSWEEQLPFFQEACSYMGENKPTWLMILGHWDEDGAGAATNMNVPSVVAKVELIPGCNVATGLKGWMGHKHCNQIIQPGKLFMAGGSGFLHGSGPDPPGCDEAGLVYLRTTVDRMEIVMYDYTQEADYNALLACVGKNGLGGCTQLGTVWLNQTVADGMEGEVPPLKKHMGYEWAKTLPVKVKGQN
jgi:hypothetical protein